MSVISQLKVCIRLYYSKVDLSFLAPVLCFPIYP